MELELIVEKIRKTIKDNKLINKKDKIVVGVSGGPDSMCLLHVLIMLKNELEFDLVVAHINHMIRKEANSETEYVKDFCKKNNIECFVKIADVLKVAEKEKIGTEEEGRKIRYNFFEEVRIKTNSNKIATAHNANDNAETGNRRKQHTITSKQCRKTRHSKYAWIEKATVGQTVIK